MSRIREIIGSRFAGIFCFLFAIANRIVFASLYSLIGVDTKLQLVYAENLLAGRGMGVTKYFTADLNTPVFDTQQIFPPGFSLTIIPFLALFGGDDYTAVLAYDIVVAILFIVAVRILGRKAGLAPELNNIITLIAGCSQYFFFMSWSSTDAIGVCLLLFSLVAVIDIINKKEHLGWVKVAGAAILFCLPFFFRFMYLPVAFLLPLYTLASGIILKNKKLKSDGFRILFACTLFLTLYFSISSLTSGNALYITDVGRGFFIDQFTEWYPFLPASFINIDFGAQLIESISGLGYSDTMFILEISNALIFAVLIFLLGRYFYKERRATQFSNHSHFIAAGSSLALVILLLLAWLTLTYKEQSWGYYKWTHVQDPRYFAFIYVFVPLVLFVCLQHYRHSLKKPMVRFFVFIAFCCLTIEVLHGIYYNGKILLSHKDLDYIRDADKGFRSFPKLIAALKNEHPDKELIVSSPDRFYLLTASQMGYKAIFDYTNFLDSDLRVSAKTILIMPIQTRDIVIISDYIEKRKPALFATIGATSFYVQEITPQVK
ncbi:MAG TPA: hypothetical protein VFP97_09770 [Chitinophagaceae bacterium]|nr:hypothetical protein [Chitinophagaceae bacterium]